MGTISNLAKISDILLQQNKQLQSMNELLQKDLEIYRKTIKDILDVHAVSINGIDVVALKDLVEIVSKNLAGLKKN